MNGLDLHTGAMTLIIGDDDESPKPDEELHAKPVLNLLSSRHTGMLILPRALGLRPVHFENLP